MDKILKDFRHFAIDKAGVKPTVLDDQVRMVNNSMTPCILEERQMNVVAFDVFSRLLYDRIIYFAGEVNSTNCDTAIAQLLYLSSVDNRDINMYVNSPGGSVYDGLGVVDTMNFVNCDIATICVGMAASMGSVLLSNGTKGKRYILPHGRVMIHSVISGFKGHTADVKIEMEQTVRCQDDVYRILSENTGRSFEEIEAMCDRDRWFIGSEAVDLGIVDNVLTKDKKEE